MKIKAAYPLITTMNLQATRDFYVEHFGLEVIFEASWVVMLGRSTGKISLGFMASNHPTNPPDPDVFDGRGMIVTIQVEDAANACATLQRKGVPITYDLHDERWGQRHFTTLDPSGIIVDVVEQTEPAEGYWDKYLPAREPASA
jgi:catechol 2,3-dioxygenase-like lactoylglutathione lyase family enzyme